MEMLEQLDQQIFLFFNGMHNPFWDTVMYWISYKFTWVPLYLAMLIYFVYKQKSKAILTILMAVAVIALADQISVHFFKNVFLRYRPSHNIDLQSLIHLVDGHKGGQYGFVSSHATNAFGFAIYSALVLQRKSIFIALLIWAVVVSYSRIYLGVHYPGDLLGGALLGSSIAGLIYLLRQKIGLKFNI